MGEGWLNIPTEAAPSNQNALGVLKKHAVIVAGPKQVSRLKIFLAILANNRTV